MLLMLWLADHVNGCNTDFDQGGGLWFQQSHPAQLLPHPTGEGARGQHRADQEHTHVHLVGYTHTSAHTHAHVSCTHFLAKFP